MMMTVTLMHSAQGASTSRLDANTTFLAKPDYHQDHPQNNYARGGLADNLLALQQGTP
jgi:hypothetical protein